MRMLVRGLTATLDHEQGNDAGGRRCAGSPSCDPLAARLMTSDFVVAVGVPQRYLRYDIRGTSSL